MPAKSHNDAKAEFREIRRILKETAAELRKVAKTQTRIDKALEHIAAERKREAEERKRTKRRKNSPPTTSLSAALSYFSRADCG
jgi:ABC-type Fe3+-hydroxamate transport system substrate-binding protein